MECQLYYNRMDGFFFPSLENMKKNVLKIFAARDEIVF